MSKPNAFSYVFFFIGITALIAFYIFEYIFGSPDYFYTHFHQGILMLIVVMPIFGFGLALYGARGNLRLIGIALNAIFLVAFAPLALFKLWITSFGW
ncbi:hypothetical protein [Planomicrobium sp. CPCC 101110]|uniref:hypothetical protein n=1 Tax=Planomicrobium sp. CPCC 101110 TaxID=2599619 RepID=UPI0011B37B94|nr:hypothetical protein [Planomicrobium sp. CPCC 101110]TWT26033.1 hypothetical protein FQV30_09590 [Planomicrobium sp. CPCC 101110]